ncbi:hypothetical protein NMG60_11000737 [Bertholletia excelsa]
MGSSNSKSNARESPRSSSSSLSSCSSSGVRRSRSVGSRVFQSSCLGSSYSGDDEQVVDDPSNEHDCNNQMTNQIKSDLDHVKAECYHKVKAKQPGGTAHMSSNSDLDEWGSSNLRTTVSGVGSSSCGAFSNQSPSSSGRFLSRFSLSFRLSKASNFGSSRGLAMPNEVEELHPCRHSSGGLINRDRSSMPNEDFMSSNFQSNLMISGFSESLQEDWTTNVPSTDRGFNNSRVESTFNMHSPRTLTGLDRAETRLPGGQIGSQAPVVQNTCISRTFRVGRLRDRLLHRSSLTESMFSSLQEEGEVRGASQFVERGASGGAQGVLASDENALNSSTTAYASSGMPCSLQNGQNFDMESSRAREARYHDLFEHRSNFLERRRRIRSQVRAPQQLGSHFENSPGHERSCIVSGQNQTGHCTCRISARPGSSMDDDRSRVSISRIVMLAEALFEVLDEIHQQSVVLSSRPSMSSIGSVPAPNEIVESLPVILYRKSQKHLNEEAAQCYICFVAYEEGDSVRILPCHHEFHQTCVDKWLKEIHGVCPLCRHDICRTGSVPLQN